MSVVTVSHPTKIINGNINLPASKSISNRALILQAISKHPVQLHNLSEADDTVIMQQALIHHTGDINIKNAGTCMRFLAAYFAAMDGTEVTLQCDPRMELRPVHILVDALRQAGADINYLDKEGFPPLQIKGKQLSGGAIKIDASVSSQFISALMMIAPLCTNGLTLEHRETVSSLPYIDMTAQMMKQFGFNVSIDYPVIHIPGQGNIPAAGQLNYTIERDWSAAGYWYEIAALSEEAEILLEGLTKESLQGDHLSAEIMKCFGVETTQAKEGIIIKKIKTEDSRAIAPVQTINLVNMPDFAPALAVTTAATNTDLILTGLQNLVIKESDRLQTISNELRKLGFNITAEPTSLTIKRIPQFPIPDPQFPILTYGDHRIAMAFAPLALALPNIIIEDPEVVEKSYPHFWDDLQKAGFNLKR